MNVLIERLVVHLLHFASALRARATAIADSRGVRLVAAGTAHCLHQALLLAHGGRIHVAVLLVIFVLRPANINM